VRSRDRVAFALFIDKREIPCVSICQ
jgi:hypothetical protein